MTDDKAYHIAEDGRIVLEHGGEVEWSDDRDNGSFDEIELLPNGWIRVQAIDYSPSFYPPKTFDAIHTHNDVKL